jgi:hypothetical protein
MKGTRRRAFKALGWIAMFAGCASATGPTAQEVTDPDPVFAYTIVDTGQTDCFSDSGLITCPISGSAFSGQDAQHNGPQPSYRDNGNGTITDLNTGLMWQKTPELENQPTYAEAVAGPSTLDLAGYDDWRLPSLKELYSLMDFNGNSRAFTLVPYVDTDYLDFAWGDESAGDRIIDAQYWTSNQYVGLVMNGEVAIFGVNFADGRIKGYPRDIGPKGVVSTHFVRYVRGNTDYGKNLFQASGNATVLDAATGLEWQRTDDGVPRNWEEALGYCEALELDGETDWRLPNAKELHSIVDYDQAPDALDPSRRGPALDPIFGISDPEGWFWSSTTHLEGPSASAAVYIAFGQATGYMGPQSTLMNVHGAGAQRSDPKSGDPAEYASGLGPQGDVIRILNLVRCVRGGAQ